MRQFLKKKHFPAHDAGFSLIELLVVVSIFFIITTIALFKQSKFSSDILITNTAYDVALAIRQAQVYGVGSKQSGSDTLEDRRKSYGISFSYRESDSDTKFIMFSESPYDDLGKSYRSLYDATDTDHYTEVEPFSLKREQKIADFCGRNIGELWECAYSTAAGDINRLNIAFIKPNLNPVIKPDIDGGGGSQYDEAKIIVQSSLGDKCRTIYVNSVGQITVLPVESGDGGCDIE
jgi:prepilin-type N-terminal cleavage/methylation domain-containing protein